VSPRAKAHRHDSTEPQIIRGGFCSNKTWSCQPQRCSSTTTDAPVLTCALIRSTLCLTVRTMLVLCRCQVVLVTVVCTVRVPKSGILHDLAGFETTRGSLSDIAEKIAGVVRFQESPEAPSNHARPLRSSARASRSNPNVVSSEKSM
jgi:hypothetical protein